MSSIVVIDEDAAMRALMTEWLEAAGHDVEPRAATGAGRAVQLVVFDLPKVRAAADTTRRLMHLFPGAALIGVSGQLAANLPADAGVSRSAGVCHLLAKPFARDEFLAAVATCLIDAA